MYQYKWGNNLIAEQASNKNLLPFYESGLGGQGEGGGWDWKSTES